MVHEPRRHSQLFAVAWCMKGMRAHGCARLQPCSLALRSAYLCVCNYRSVVLAGRDPCMRWTKLRLRWAAERAGRAGRRNVPARRRRAHKAGGK